MTAEEYNQKMEEEVAGMNDKLAAKLCQLAYERGHSGGMEEVLGILGEMVYEFKEVNALLVAAYPEQVKR